MSKKKISSRKSKPPATSRQGRRSGPLLSGLAERHRLRNAQSTALDRFDPLVDAFDETLARLRFLTEIHGLNSEIVHLLDDARVWVIDGVDHILSEPGPHTVEEARKLLEAEFLLRDFAAAPAHLSEWAEIESWNRPSKFGFGKLRQREEKRQRLDTDMVLAPRDYWIAHSIHSHPKPLNDVQATDPDPSSSLLNSLGDQMHHAWSVGDAAIVCIDAQGLTIPDGFSELSTAAYTYSTERIRQVL